MHKLIASAAALASLVVFGTACGSDDDSANSGSAETNETTGTTATTAGTSDVEPGAFPTAEFCAAQADLGSAEDGAQRNTAIGEMQDALTEDAPPAIVDALTTLLTGDLSPEAYTAAEATLADACA